MSTYSKPRTKRQLRHPGSRSASHHQDKAQGEIRKGTSWVGVDAPERPSPERSFAGLEGHEYIYENGTWRRCKDPEELANYLERENKRRSWFLDITQRKGIPVEMLRRTKAGLEVLTTTFAPWFSDWTAAQLAAGKDPRVKLAAIRTKWLRAAQQLLADGRHVLAYALHLDSCDGHLDLVLSRQDGEGGRIGENGLRLLGPWTCGTVRQVRSGAKISAEKTAQLRRAIANFRRRYDSDPDARPLDLHLCRVLDEAADEIIGPELQPYREAYALKVPELERAHKAAALATLEDARTKLLSSSIPEPEADYPSVSQP